MTDLEGCRYGISALVASRPRSPHLSRNWRDRPRLGWRQRGAPEQRREHRRQLRTQQITQLLEAPRASLPSSTRRDARGLVRRASDQSNSPRRHRHQRQQPPARRRGDRRLRLQFLTATPPSTPSTTGASPERGRHRSLRRPSTRTPRSGVSGRRSRSSPLRGRTHAGSAS